MLRWLNFFESLWLLPGLVQRLYLVVSWIFVFSAVVFSRVVSLLVQRIGGVVLYFYQVLFWRELVEFHKIVGVLLD